MRKLLFLTGFLLTAALEFASAQNQSSRGCCNSLAQSPVRLTEAVMRNHVEHIEIEPDRMGNNTNLLGIAVFKLTFGKDGRVVCAKAISGHPLAVALLMAAVGKWRFSAYMHNGIARPACGRLRVRFSIIRNFAAADLPGH